MQVMDLLYYVRKSLLLPPYETLVLMLNNSMPSLNKTMNLLQHEEANKDGFCIFIIRMRWRLVNVYNVYF